MRTVKEIEAQITAIEADSRYQAGLKTPATIGINAPLALIQLEMETRRKTLKWVIEAEGKADNEQPITFEQFMQASYARLEMGNRWLYWQIEDEDLRIKGEWVVREKKYRARESTVLYRGDALQDALHKLKEEGG